MCTKAVKYLLIGLLVDVALVLTALFYLTLMEFPADDGYCSRTGFGGPRPPCSRGDYFAQAMLIGLHSLAFGMVVAPAHCAGAATGRGLPYRPAGPPPR